MTDDHMSDMEAMMWNVERDPWLDPNGGGIAVYDRPLDVDLFRRGMRRAVADVPRLRQRVVPGLGPLTTPRWVHDPEFDLDWHVRRIGAPGDGSLRELLDYFGPWLQDSYDHTRPLWMYILVDGLADGRGALLTKLHHAVGDGESLVKMSLAYTSDRRYLAALCVKAALPTPHYLTIRMALELASRSVTPVQGGDDDETFSSETMRYLRDQYEDLRVNEEKLAPLVAAFE